jgi:hypothetical protein
MTKNDRIILAILFTLFLALWAAKSRADNIGANFGLGLNSQPIYGVNYYYNPNLLYMDFKLMGNNQYLQPYISSGLQIDDVNLGFVAQETRQPDGSSVGAAGVELGFTEDLDKFFYVKENNSLLRDQNNNAMMGFTFSLGIHL